MDTILLCKMIFHDTHIGRTDDLVGGDQLFQPVGAPAYNSGYCKERRIQLLGNPQHIIDKTTVEVDIGTEGLAAASGTEKPRRCILNTLIQGHIIIPALGSSQFFHETLEYSLSRIGQGIDGMSDPVDQALSVISFPGLQESIRKKADYFSVIYVNTKLPQEYTSPS